MFSKIFCAAICSVMLATASQAQVDPLAAVGWETGAMSVQMSLRSSPPPLHRDVRLDQ